MADRKITDLTALAAGSQATGDLLTIVDVSEGAAADKNKKITVENLLKGIPSNVGIGTSSPTYNLQVSGTGSISSRTVATDAGGDASFFVQNDNSSIAGPLTYGTTKAAYGALGSGETAFYSNRDTTIMADGGSSRVIKFASGGNSEKMRIDGNGRVGIGTASPSSKLHIAGSTPILNIESSASSGDGAQIRFTQNFNRVGRLYMTSEAGTSSGAMHLESPEVRDIVFKGETNERCRINRYGKVLVGTTIEGAANADNLTIADSGHAGMTIRSGTSSLGGIYFSDGTSGDAEYKGVVEYNHTDDALVLFADGGEGLRIDSSQNIGIGATPSAWGGSRNAIQFDSAGAAYVCNDSTVGIVSNMYFDGANNKYINAGTASSAYFQQDNVLFQFAPSGSADANGTFTTSTRIDADGVKFGSDTAAANALDDYEEGTWTGTATLGGGTGTVNDERYTKIGNLVNVSFTVQFSGASGTCTVSGLPFTISSNVWAVGAGREDQTNGYPVFMRITENQSSLAIWSAISSGNATPFIVATGNFRCNITYVTG